MAKPLVQLRPGEEGTVVSIAAGRGLYRRLLELGLTPNARVKVVHNDGWGPVVVEIRGARIALGRGVAAKVLVS